MTQQQSPVLIFDIGSYSIKAGMSNEAKPKYIIPSAFPSGDTKFPIDKEIPMSSPVDLCIVNGEIQNKERFDFIIASIYAEYFPNEDQDPNNLYLMFSNVPYSSHKTINSIAEVAFDILPGEQLLIKPPALFTLAQYPQLTALCVDIGHDITHVVPIEDGFICSTGVARSFSAGSALNYFISSYQLRLDQCTTWQNYSDANKYKIEHAIVSKTCLEDELNKNLTDDQVTGYTCGELLFSPSLYEAATPEGQQPSERVSSLMECDSIFNLIKHSIENCDMKNKNNLWSNIILTGGSSQIPGLKERLQDKLCAICPPMSTPKITVADDPILSCWQGGTICSQFIDTETWLSKDQYHDDESSVIKTFVQYGITNTRVNNTS